MTGTRRGPAPVPRARATRIEGAGRWRPAPGAPPREVRLVLGRSTLVIADADGRALAHWSLPAIERLASLHAARGAALYAPGSNADETLETTDPRLMGAIARRSRAASARRRRRARRPWLILAPLALALGAAAVHAAPMLLSRALRDVPHEIRAGLGEAVLARLAEPTGGACEAPDGRAALDRLAARLAPGLNLPEAEGEREPGRLPRIAVLRGGMEAAVALPGGIFALPIGAIARAAEPGIAAGHLLVAAGHAGPEDAPGDPLAAFVRAIPRREALRLLTAARVSPGAIEAYAEAIAWRRAPSAAVIEGEALAPLAARFTAAGVSAAAYARAVGSPALLAADPMPEAGPALADAEWIALQGVCDG